MKGVVALLLVANAALFLWIGGPATDDEERFSAQPEVNPEGVLLLHEIRASGAAASAPATPAADQPSAGASVSESSDGTRVAGGESIRPNHPAPALAADGGSACYRIGPFKAEAHWLAANRWMRARQLDYQAVRSERREMRAVRVYLGPFKSRDAAQPVMDDLEDRGIEHFADSGEGRSVRISLGYFTQEALAVKFIAHLLSQGVEARSRLEYRVMGPFDWMEASLPTADRERLLSRNWQGATMLPIPCDGISPPNKSDQSRP